ncbi:BTAD domain-containing putative transcriptional regulator [Actinoplanes sp. NPDC048796]|uniref:AfsR/SARP family transcriptional regulator n=1 Tax=Actinoplanes sp. NPDC048796 TaxID=3155640 RepID=UPI0033D0138E
MSVLSFRVLGPLVVERGTETIDLGGPQRRLVLGLLLAHAGQVVSADELADALWGEHPPPSYRVQLQGMVSDLRRRLAAGGDRAAAPILTRPPGYLVRVSGDSFDLAQFRADVAGARALRASGDDEGAARLLEVALGRWRGPAFSGLEHAAIGFVAAAAEESRAEAHEERVDALLAGGRVAGLAAELTALVAEHPLRETFHRQLMTVYAGTGRAAEAFTVYRDLRRRLVDEVGVEPSEPLRELHRRILAEDPGVLAGDGRPPVNTYRQLPPDIAEFTGRAAEVAAMASSVCGDPATAATLWTVAGMAGVGKTRLALRVTHQLVAAGRYDEGQLYVDLRGFAPAEAPADPSAVLESFLRASGVPAGRIPPDLGGRSAVYRDLLAGRRMVVVLDNAADEEQVLPLLPGSSACLVIVTSRRTLALDGALSVELHPFTEAEAVELLGEIAGRARLDAEPAPARELAALCGHLPLAVALAGQRLRARPCWTVEHLVTRLSGRAHRLDELVAGRRAVEPVLARSYDALDPAARRLFRLLGLHPGDDMTPASVAALAGLEVAEAEAGLEALLDEHLLQQSVPGRYHLHDLLREYAVRLSRRDDSTEERDRALRAVLDWYLHGTHAVPLPADRRAARQWTRAEYANVRAALFLAASTPWYEHAQQLATFLQA